MGKNRDTQQFGDEETTRRAKEALRRAFATPPQPRKPTGKKGESPVKPGRGGQRRNAPAKKE